MISYNTENVKMPALPRRATNAWIRAVAAHYGKKVGDVVDVVVLSVDEQRHRISLSMKQAKKE